MHFSLKLFQLKDIGKLKCHQWRKDSAVLNQNLYINILEFDYIGMYFKIKILNIFYQHTSYCRDIENLMNLSRVSNHPKTGFNWAPS